MFHLEKVVERGKNVEAREREMRMRWKHTAFPWQTHLWRKLRYFEETSKCDISWESNVDVIPLPKDSCLDIHHHTCLFRACYNIACFWSTFLSILMCKKEKNTHRVHNLGFLFLIIVPFQASCKIVRKCLNVKQHNERRKKTSFFVKRLPFILHKNYMQIMLCIYNS